MNGDKDMNDFMSTFNKKDIVNFLNDKLNLNLDNVNVETIGQHGTRGTNNLIDNNASALIIYQNKAGNESKNFSEINEFHIRDSNTSSDNSNSSGCFSQTNGVNQQVLSFEQSKFVTLESVPNENNKSKAIEATEAFINMNQKVAHESLIGLNSMKGGKKQLNYCLGSQWKISDNVYKHAIQLEYTTNPLKYELIGQEDERSLCKLNKLEENRLDEVNQHLRPLCIYVQEKEKIITDISEGLQCFEHTIKKIIIAVKNIGSFKCMCQDDQIALLKGSAGEIKGLLNIRYFNPCPWDGYPSVSKYN